MANQAAANARKFLPQKNPVAGFDPTIHVLKQP
jgi:hypothetical protein